MDGDPLAPSLEFVALFYCADGSVVHIEEDIEGIRYFSIDDELFLMEVAPQNTPFCPEMEIYFMNGIADRAFEMYRDAEIELTLKSVSGGASKKIKFKAHICSKTGWDGRRGPYGRPHGIILAPHILAGLVCKGIYPFDGKQWMAGRFFNAENLALPHLPRHQGVPGMETCLVSDLVESVATDVAGRVFYSPF